jgi:hypothetical protein
MGVHGLTPNTQKQIPMKYTEMFLYESSTASLIKYLTKVEGKEREKLHDTKTYSSLGN